MASVRHLGLFPWCIPTVEANPPFSLYPVSAGNDSDVSLKWYWRVKTWRFVGTATIGSASVSQNTLMSNNAAYEDGVYIVPQPENEKGLVCAQGTRAIHNRFADDEFGFYLYDAIADPRGIFFSGNFYPSVIAYITCGGVLFSSASDTTPPPATFGTATIDGLSFSLTTGGTLTPGYSASITITAEEYWPYDPGDGGGPIYDSATGAQLRPFPS